MRVTGIPLDSISEHENLWTVGIEQIDLVVIKEFPCSGSGKLESFHRPRGGQNGGPSNPSRKSGKGHGRARTKSGDQGTGGESSPTEVTSVWPMFGARLQAMMPQPEMVPRGLTDKGEEFPVEQTVPSIESFGGPRLEFQGVGILARDQDSCP